MMTEPTSVSTEAQRSADNGQAGDPQYRRLRYLRAGFWLIAGITGFLQIWLQDHIIHDDALSYLDSGDLLWRGDFSNAITNHWSPGLPFLLGLALKVLHPTGFWEIAVVKLVDLIIFVTAIGCFDFFIGQFCEYHERNTAAQSPRIQSKLALPAVGYLLFLSVLTRWLPAWETTPDMLVTAIVFVVLGLLLKMRMGATGFGLFAIFGAVLGCGYLAKAPMFPLAFVFLVIASLLVGDIKKAVPRVALSFGIFALIATPLVWELSVLAGGLTFGKSGAWNYARWIDGVALPYHWHGEPPGSGTPVHPTRVLFQKPTVYEFGSPVLGTFPPWRDPYYWFTGITPHFDLAGQWRVTRGNLKNLKEMATGLNPGFAYGLLILFFMTGDWRMTGRILARQWFLLVPSIVAIAMFSIVLVESRYIAPYPVVIGLTAFASVGVPGSARSLKLVNRTVLLAVLLSALSAARPAAGELLSFAKSLHKNEMLGQSGPWYVMSEAVSNALRAQGVARGDKVAYIGESGDFYWARLVGVQINAEIWQDDTTAVIYSLVPNGRFLGVEPSVDIYWRSPPETKEKIDRILREAGSKAIVTDAFPAGDAAQGWDKIPNTSYYIHLLPDGAGKDTSQSASTLQGTAD